MRLSFYSSAEVVAATFAAEYPGVAKPEREGAWLTADQMSVAAAFVARDQRRMRVVMLCRRLTGNCNSVFVLKKAVRVLEGANGGGQVLLGQHKKVVARCADIREEVGVRLNGVGLDTKQSHQTTAALAKLRGRRG
jgi:hypothetical protein